MEKNLVTKGAISTSDRALFDRYSEAKNANKSVTFEDINNIRDIFLSIISDLKTGLNNTISKNNSTNEKTVQDLLSFFGKFETKIKDLVNTSENNFFDQVKILNLRLSQELLRVRKEIPKMPSLMGTEQKISVLADKLARAEKMLKYSVDNAVSDVKKLIPDSETGESLVGKIQTVKRPWLSIEAIDGDFNTKVTKQFGGGNTTPLGVKINSVDYGGIRELEMTGSGVSGQIVGGKLVATISGSGTGGSGHIIQEEGSSQTARSKLNFIGSTVTATDNAGNDSTDVTILTPSLRSIYDFGAVGDGSADDTAAFTASLTAQNNVILGKGTFKITSRIALTEGQGIIGTSGSVISADFNGYAISAIVTGAEAPGIILKGFRLVGAATTTFKATSSVGLKSGIEFNGSSKGSVFSNVHIYGFDGVAVYMSSSSAGTLRTIAHNNCVDVKVHNCHTAFSNLYEYQEYLGCQAVNCYYGFYTNAGNTFFESCQAVDCGVGLYVGGTSNEGHGNWSGGCLNHCTIAIDFVQTIYGFNVNGAHLYGGATIYLRYAKGVIVSGCSFDSLVLYTNGSTSLVAGGGKNRFVSCMFSTAATILASTPYNAEVQFEGCLDWSGNLVGFTKSAIAIWPLRELAGNRLDITPAKLHLTPSATGISRNTGKSWASAEFDGSAGYMEANDSSLRLGTGSFTIHAWVYFDVVNVDQCIASCINDASPNGGYEVYLEGSSGKVRFRGFNSSTEVFNVLPNTALSASTWYSVLVRYTHTTKIAEVLVGGVVSYGTATGSDVMTAPTVAFRLGATSDGANFLNGRIEQAAVWSRKFDDGQAAALWRNNLFQELTV